MFIKVHKIKRLAIKVFFFSFTWSVLILKLIDESG